MVKLKLNREQLFTVCGFTNPAVIEGKINHCLKWMNYQDLDRLFTLIQIGETVSKKYLYTLKNNYTISLKYAEAAALLAYTYSLEQLLDEQSYENNVLQILRQDLHKQILNFQRRFQGQGSAHLLLSTNGANYQIEKL